MKQFFKFILAACLGVFLAIAIMIGIFALIGTIAGKKPSIENHSVLKLDLNRVIPEKTGNVETQSFSFEQSNNIGLQEIKRLIRHAANDGKVDGILIENSSVNLGQAGLSSLRDEIEDFKSSGKFVYSYADYMSQSAYFIASAADSVFLNPNGMIDIKGYGSMIPFFTDAMHKLGIKANVFYAGDYKSATEPFRRTEMSEHSERQTREFLNAMVDIYIDDVAASRNLTTETVNNIMTNYLGRDAQLALENGLVDELLYKDEMEDRIRNHTGQKSSNKISYVSIDKYDSSVTFKREGSLKKEVAVLFAEGNVTYGSDDKGEINEVKYLKALEKIEHDDDTKALVLRVNSGGGSALTSDLIWHAIENVKKSGKPVIASFGDVAASGGYYIAAGADTILAQPNTLTGSIGVFTLMPNLHELVTQKMGIDFDTVKTHPMAVAFTSIYNLNNQEETILQEGIDDIYDQFVGRVAAGRHMTKEEVHAVAQGRVWTGKAAMEVGLVDMMGDLDDAIRIAAEMAGIDGSPRVKNYPYTKETFLDQMMKNIASSEEFASIAKVKIDPNHLKLLRSYDEIQDLVSDQSPQARMLYKFSYD